MTTQTDDLLDAHLRTLTAETDEERRDRYERLIARFIPEEEREHLRAHIHVDYLTAKGVHVLHPPAMLDAESEEAF